MTFVAVLVFLWVTIIGTVALAQQPAEAAQSIQVAQVTQLVQECKTLLKQGFEGIDGKGVFKTPEQWNGYIDQSVGLILLLPQSEKVATLEKCVKDLR